ncbi:MAG: nuclease A inhibitor family protein [Pyrinomonadaceae bacterium]
MKTFFHQNESDGDDLSAQIQSACDGLVYVSETDAPVTSFRPSETSAEESLAILAELGRADSEPVETIDFNRFFGKLTSVKDWFDAAHKERAHRFLKLQRLLEAHLSDLTVLRAGEVRLDIVVIGTDKNGRLMGIRTAAVET